MIKKILPTFQAFISPEVNDELKVDCVAIVDNPAIQKHFIAFSADEAPGERLAFAEINSAQRIVIGPAMIPDLLIYRNNQLGEHNVFFDKQTVETIAERFFAESLHVNANEMHNPKMKIEGMSFFMSFIRNTEKGLIGLAGDYPEGTWFLGARVNDDGVWQKVQDGTYKGFSVEGLFQYKETPKTEEELINEIEALLQDGSEVAFNRISEILG